MKTSQISKFALVILVLLVAVFAKLDQQTKTNQIQKGKTYRRAVSADAEFSFDASTRVTVEVIKKIKRDMLFFVEGFSFISEDVILESTGLENQTEIHHINLKDMSITNSYTFESNIFGEGSVMIKDAETQENVVFMMTYKNGIVYKMDENLSNVIAEYKLPKEMREGWGMTKLDEETILATDGSNRLFHIDPSNFTIKKIVKVLSSQGNPQSGLNEVEIIDGKLYANIFTTHKIVVVDPQTGKVLDTLNFTPLVQSLESEKAYHKYTSGLNSNNVLNGIAYNPNTQKTLITGKNWPYIYEIRIINKS